MRSCSLWAVPLGLMVLCAPSLLGETASSGPTPWGLPMSQYSARRLDGEGELSLEELRGRTVLLNFWATWCLPCRHEIPVLSALFREHRAAGLEVVGVSLDVAAAEDKVRSLVAQERIPYTILVDADSRASEIFQIAGLPVSFLVSPEGELLWSRVGPILENDPELGGILARELSQELAPGPGNPR